MSFKVTVLPSGKQFSMQTGESILDAALRTHVVLPYGCRNGACGSCKAQVLSGQVTQGPVQTSALSAAERAEGYALMCCALAQSDLTVQARILLGAGDIPVRKMPCRIAAIDYPVPDVAILRLQLPAAERLQFLAGQYIDVLLKDGARRRYSIAVAPHEVEDGLELHVRHLSGGRFTDPLFGATQPATKMRDILRFEGPLGTFFLRTESTKPIVFVVSGTGFAPVRAIIEDMRFKGISRPISLYWGGRRPADLYSDALARQWAEQISDFRYVPVVSDQRAGDEWSGRTGMVHLSVLEDFPDLSEFQVYACGAPAMVDAARRDFVGLGELPAQEFFADAFVSAADLAGFLP